MNLPGAGPGRPKGLPNKATQAGREAVAMFVDGNAERLQAWLDAVADDPKYGPKVAFELFMTVVEYHIPKLQRTEQKVAVEGKVAHSFEVTFK